VRAPAEQTLTEDFDAQYRRHQSPVLRSIERKACGCDYGGTSWTTRSEADRICELLNLRSGRRLLEIGAGSGWPGLYLARRIGCDLTLVDLPLEGLRIAARRATSDGIAGRCWIAAASGAALPFEDHAVDAISHSDVLCCLDAKLDVLHTCRRVIRARATMVFTVISITTGLSATDHARAIDLGPPFVDSQSDYATMLARTGWHIRDRVDLTADYARTARRYLQEQENHRDELEELLGSADLDAQLTRMGAKLAAIDAGLFRRELYVTAPAGSVDRRVESIAAG